VDNQNGRNIRRCRNWQSGQESKKFFCIGDNFASQFPVDLEVVFDDLFYFNLYLVPICYPRVHVI